MREVGDKDDGDPGVGLADLLRGGHTVNELHLHIHQDNVIDGAVVVHDGITVVKTGDLKDFPGFFFETLQIGSQDLYIVLFVFHDGNADHADTSVIIKMVLLYHGIRRRKDNFVDEKEDHHGYTAV